MQLQGAAEVAAELSSRQESEEVSFQQGEAAEVEGEQLEQVIE